MNGKFYDFFSKPVEAFILRRVRSELLSHAHGQTLEVGVGTGANFDYYPEDAEIFAIDPDPDMRILAERKARHDPLHHLSVANGNAETLFFASDSFDTVVGTLVFCTIPNPRAALEEIYRVLKPGGSFLLLEHIRKNTPVTGWLLDHLTPLWKHIAGGCHLNRDPSRTLREVGFRADHVQTLWSGLGKVWYLKKI